MLVATNEIGNQQAAPTEKTNEAATMLMDYAHTYPNAIIRYHDSDMCLHIDSYAAFLVLPKAKSSSAGHFYFSDRVPASIKKPSPKPNGAILTECQTLRSVMTSAAEAETITVFNNGKAAIPIIITAEELGHNQPAATFKTDNSTCHGILNATMRQKRSKHYDMKIWWFRDQIKKGLFRLFWEKGCLNLADYFTKHHPPTHHRLMRPKYLQPETIKQINSLLSLVQGCVPPVRDLSPRLMHNGRI